MHPKMASALIRKMGLSEAKLDSPFVETDAAALPPWDWFTWCIWTSSLIILLASRRVTTRWSSSRIWRSYCGFWRRRSIRITRQYRSWLKPGRALGIALARLPAGYWSEPEAIPGTTLPGYMAANGGESVIVMIFPCDGIADDWRYVHSRESIARYLMAIASSGQQSPIRYTVCENTEYQYGQ